MVPGLLAIHKPRKWEVDTQANESVSGLSFWLRAVHSEMPCPLTHDTEHSFGFIHRLDIPSSGLLLAAETFEAYYLLQWQLITGALAREYVVLCHAWALPKLHWVDAQILPRSGTDSRTGDVTARGKPSQTWVTVLVYGACNGRQ
jgi:23S rRNA-/tRNA-specific pseudouridylate synthase